MAIRRKYLKGKKFKKQPFPTKQQLDFVFTAVKILDTLAGLKMGGIPRRRGPL